MALNNISVKVCGNPDSNSGFIPLLLFNSPSFTVEDQFYVGFDNCSYFFSMKVETTQTVYKLIKNNVKSYGASREGSLVISFSIPKGYKLEGGYTPYDVLTQLKEEFLKCCMTCKDPSKESYEYKPGRVDQHILDEKIKKFTIAPANIPHRVMNSNGAIGYIMRPEEEILKFFQDTKYPELQIYKEVLLAESVNNSNYTLIPNIIIPRLKIYSLEVNGVLQNTKYSNVDAIIKVASGNSSDPYYNHKSVKFCIRDLQEGKVIENGIELDSVEEIIKVNTTTWVTPKVKKINLKVIPQANQNEVLMSNVLQITCAGRNVGLSSDFSFTLIGNEIAYLQTIKVELKPNPKYVLGNFGVYGDELRVTIQKKPDPKPTNPSRGIHKKYPEGIGGQPANQVKESPVIDIKLIFARKSDKFDFGKKKSLVIKVLKKGETKETISSEKVPFNNINGKDLCEGHMLVPKYYMNSGYYLGFENKDFSYDSINPICFQKDEYELTDKDFAPQSKSFIEKNREIVIIPLILVVVFVIGGITGYLLHNPISKLIDSPKTEEPSETPKGQGVEAIGMDTPRLDDQTVEKFLSGIDKRLKSKDITFEDIDTSFVFYDKYKKIIASKDNENKVFDRLNDYRNMVSAIRNGDIETIKTFVNNYPDNRLHVWQQHVEIAKKIVKDKASIKKFRDADFANLKSFNDVYMLYSERNDERKFNCDVRGCGFVAENQSDLRQHKQREHSSSSSTSSRSRERYTCSQCPGGNMYFDTQRELNNHIRNHHSER